MFIFGFDPAVFSPFADEADDRFSLGTDPAGHIVTGDRDHQAEAMFFRLAVESSQQEVGKLLGGEGLRHATVVLKLEKTL